MRLARRGKRLGVEKDILDLISRETAGFSKGQRQIAKFIVENYDKAAFMTAGQLGLKVGVSESTVVRFASALHFSGYPDMRKALQEMVRGRMNSLQRIEVGKELLDEENVLKTVLISDMEKLHTTLSEINKKDFDAAVSEIIKARNLYIVGMRSATALAGFMGYYLNLLLDNVRLVSDNAISEIYEQMLHIDEDDLIIGISFPRYSRRTVMALDFAKKRGARIIALTDTANSPFVSIADICLFARSDMVSFLDSLVAPLSLINALIVTVGMKNGKNLEETFGRLEKLWTEHHVYENDES